jgi:ribonuclease HIII
MGVYSEKFPINKQEEFKTTILQNFDAILNPKQYAFWEIKHPDFTAVFYNSSKFTVQGKNIEKVLKILNISTQNTDTQKDEYELILTPHIGTDESGKGDFFGPLVTAGVFVNEKNRKLFEDLGIRDSKTLKDDKIIKMALEIQKNSAFSVIAISNKKYNELYNKFKNLNKLLAWSHASVIENILEKTDCKMALSDKFGDESLIKNALKTKGKQIILEQRVRGESDIAVAAASVLARATFVNKMQSMEKFYGLEFSKGCNDTVKSQAKNFISKYGKDRLNEVCKMHFKTYNDI